MAYTFSTMFAGISILLTTNLQSAFSTTCVLIVSSYFLVFSHYTYSLIVYASNRILPDRPDVFTRVWISIYSVCKWRNTLAFWAFWVIIVINWNSSYKDFPLWGVDCHSVHLRILSISYEDLWSHWILQPNDDPFKRGSIGLPERVGSAVVLSLAA